MMLIHPTRFMKKSLLLLSLGSGVNATSENIAFVESEAVSSLQIDMPKSFNWMDSGCMPLPRFQGGCGSCAIISLLSTAEFSMCMANRRYTNLSEQQVVDCIYKETGQSGCLGTDANDVINYIVENINDGSMCTAEERPSSRWGSLRPGDHCKDYSTCSQYKTARDGSSHKLRAYKMKLDNVSAVKKALLKYGPLALTMDTRVRSFTYYGDFTAPLLVSDNSLDYVPGSGSNLGAITADMCHSQEKDTHAAVLVGWEVDPRTKEQYWTLWNTFSTAWGNGGLGKIRMEADHCGIIGKKHLMAFSPLDAEELGWAGSMATIAALQHDAKKSAGKYGSDKTKGHITEEVVNQWLDSEVQSSRIEKTKSSSAAAAKKTTHRFDMEPVAPSVKKTKSVVPAKVASFAESFVEGFNFLEEVISSGIGESRLNEYTADAYAHSYVQAGAYEIETFTDLDETDDEAAYTAPKAAFVAVEDGPSFAEGSSVKKFSPFSSKDKNAADSKTASAASSSKFTYMPADQFGANDKIAPSVHAVSEVQEAVGLSIAAGLELISSGRFRFDVDNAQLTRALGKDIIVQRQRFKVAAGAAIATSFAVSAGFWYLVAWALKKIALRKSSPQEDEDDDQIKSVDRETASSAAAYQTVIANQPNAAEGVAKR